MLKPLLSIARFTVLEAVRTRLPWLALGLSIGVMLIAEFSASLALTDTASYRASIYGALSRLSLVLVVALFVASSIAREMGEHVLDLSLSRPVPRAVWFLGRLLGFGAGVVLLAVLACVAPLLFAPPAGVAVWGVSLAAELWLVAAACLTCVVALGQVTLAVTALAAFYVLSRAMGAIVLMSTGPAVDPQAVSSVVIAKAVWLLSLLLPGLDRFTASAWLAGALPDLAAVGDIVTQTLVYTAVLAAIGLFDLYRREL